MKNLWISVKITLAMCLLLGVGYVLVLRGVSALAGPNGGQAETLTLDGRVVGAANVGQQFTGGRYFWGRPSSVDYNGGGSGGSNKATTNPEYLADVEQRVQDFLAAHPYLSRGEVPSEMVTASGSGLDPDISPRGARCRDRGPNRWLSPFPKAPLRGRGKDAPRGNPARAAPHRPGIRDWS